jgi:hypothetical protein
MKRCPCCLHYLPDSSFYASKDGGLTNWCADCMKHPHKQWTPTEKETHALVDALLNWNPYGTATVRTGT